MQNLRKWLPQKCKILFLRLTFHQVVISKRVKIIKVSVKTNLWNVANRFIQIELNNQTTTKDQLIVAITKKIKLLSKRYLKIREEEVILLKVGSKNKVRTVLQRPALISSGLILTTLAHLQTKRVRIKAHSDILLNGKRSEHPDSEIKVFKSKENECLCWVIRFSDNQIDSICTYNSPPPNLTSVYTFNPNCFN